MNWRARRTAKRLSPAWRMTQARLMSSLSTTTCREFLGTELVRLLRERSFAGKIMVLSAHLSTEVRAAYEAMDVDAMMDKPFSVKALRAKLNQLAA